jgi:hypothetical protein
MTTTFSVIQKSCGLSHRESADFLGTRIDTVKSWSTGRNAAPQGVIAELRSLHRKITLAAQETIRDVEKLSVERAPLDAIELGLASDDHEARSLGWPCVGAHAAMVGIVAARLDVPIRVVPRGSTAASAAAADEHDKRRR